MADSYKVRPQLTAVARQALESYGLAEAAISEPVGGNNFVFRVERNGEAYALRIHRSGYRKQTHIEAELTYLASLQAQATVSVPRPIGNLQGRYVTKVLASEGISHCCSLLTWLAGKQKAPGNGLGPAALGRIGRSLGQIHSFSEGFSIPPQVEFPSLVAIGSLLDRVKLVDNLDLSEQRLIRRTVDQITPALAALYARIDQVGIVHGDFILKNILHHGRTTHVIDFDDCGVSNFLHDFSGILENLHSYENFNQLVSYFLSGYRQVRPLDPVVEQYFDAMVAFRHVNSLVWIAGKRQDGQISDSFYRRVLKSRLNALESITRLDVVT